MNVDIWKYRIVKEKLSKISKNDRLENLILNQYNENDTNVYDDNIKIPKRQLKKIDKTITLLYEDYKNDIMEFDDYKRFYKTKIKGKEHLQYGWIDLNDIDNYNLPICLKDILKTKQFPVHIINDDLNKICIKQK